MLIKIISFFTAGIILSTLIIYGIFVYPYISHTFKVNFHSDKIWEIPEKKSAPISFEKYDFGYFSALLPKINKFSTKKELIYKNTSYESYTYKNIQNEAQAFELIIYEPPLTEVKFNSLVETLREYPVFKKSLEDEYYDFYSHEKYSEYKYNPFYLRLKGDLIKGESNCYNHTFTRISMNGFEGIAYRWESEKGETAHIELMINDYILEFRITVKAIVFNLTDILEIILSNIEKIELEKGFYNPIEK